MNGCDSSRKVACREDKKAHDSYFPSKQLHAMATLSFINPFLQNSERFVPYSATGKVKKSGKTCYVVLVGTSDEYVFGVSVETNHMLPTTSLKLVEETTKDVFTEVCEFRSPTSQVLENFTFTLESKQTVKLIDGKSRIFHLLQCDTTTSRTITDTVIALHSVTTTETDDGEEWKCGDWGEYELENIEWIWDGEDF